MKLIRETYEKIGNKPEKDITSRILRVMEKFKNDEFCGKNTRLFASFLSYVITEDNEDIGFLYLVKENYNNILFMDIGVISKYRGRGIASSATKEVVDIMTQHFSDFVIAEVRSNNIASLKVVEKLNGIKVGEQHYLLQPERKKEYLEYASENNVDLSKSTYDYVSMMKEIMDNYSPKTYKK